MNKLLKHIALLNLCLAAASLVGSAWVAKTSGLQAYWAGAVAFLVVGLAASLALVLTYLSATSNGNTTAANGQGAVSGVLLAMLVRMGLPLAVLVLLMQTKNPLMDAGLFGLLTMNYLIALPLETLLSLQYINKSKPNAST